eukprot:TRINITY_DN516_c0_g1_i3.p1 TRINITY_DN516_c0_g1~~TRINITY_DN516_c0_g1_i3.p1  ORF type:complete len:157 (+),score=40.87 TRINITY_DN516_c0_g1_i3:317-787(+)
MDFKYKLLIDSLKECMEVMANKLMAYESGNAAPCPNCCAENVDQEESNQSILENQQVETHEEPLTELVAVLRNQAALNEERIFNLEEENKASLESIERYEKDIIRVHTESKTALNQATRKRRRAEKEYKRLKRKVEELEFILAENDLLVYSSSSSE